MANRKILYGYQITHGELVIRAEEQLIVHKVFISGVPGPGTASNGSSGGASPGWSLGKNTAMSRLP